MRRLLPFLLVAVLAMAFVDNPSDKVYLEVSKDEYRMIEAGVRNLPISFDRSAPLVFKLNQQYNKQYPDTTKKK